MAVPAIDPKFAGMMLVAEFGGLCFHNAAAGQPVGMRKAFNGNQSDHDPKYGAPKDETKDRIGTRLKKLRHSFLIGELSHTDSTRCRHAVRARP